MKLNVYPNSQVIIDFRFIYNIITFTMFKYIKRPILPFKPKNKFFFKAPENV